MRSFPDEAVSPDEAVAVIQSGMKVFIHGACATPTPLVEALARRTDIEGVEVYHLHTAGPAPFADEACAGRIFSYSLFTGPSLRKPMAEGRADFIPVFLSDIPGLFTSGRIALDAALIQLSPPDAHGHCTLGPSVDAALSAATAAGTVIAEINASMPRTTGNSAIPSSRVDRYIATDRPLIEHPPGEETEVEARIGMFVAELVEDGSCLLMGIGTIPDAVLRRLELSRQCLYYLAEALSTCYQTPLERFQSGLLSDCLTTSQAFPE